MQHIDERGQEQDVDQAIETIRSNREIFETHREDFVKFFGSGPRGERGVRPRSPRFWGR